MLATLVLCATALVPQDQDPRGPTSRPSDGTERMVPADWGDDAPGRAVLRGTKFLPIKGSHYASADKVADRVRDEDLVIGLVVGGVPVAYPINMLGGPHREIVNEEYGGVAFCVNW